MSLTYLAYVITHETHSEVCDIVFPSLPGCTIGNASTHFSLAEMQSLAHDVMQAHLEGMVDRAETIPYSDDTSPIINYPHADVGDDLLVSGGQVVAIMFVPLRHDRLIECIGKLHIERSNR